MNSLQLLAGQKEISLTELTEQIKKDLSLSGIDTLFFEKILSADDLLKNLQQFIQEILTYRPADFDRFMYRVDVPEKEFSSLITTDLDTIVNKIVFLVLKREMQKLVFRKQFGQ